MPVSVVLDINIGVSAAFSPFNSPGRCVELAVSGKIRSITSDERLATLREKLVTRAGAPAFDADAAVGAPRLASLVMRPAPLPKPVTTDPEDDAVLAPCLAGREDLLIAGDKRHLLPLGEFGSTTTVTAREFLQCCEQRIAGMD